MRYAALLLSILGCGAAPLEDGEFEEMEGSSTEDAGDESSEGIATDDSGEASEAPPADAPDRSPPRALAGTDCGEEGHVIACMLDEGSGIGAQACAYPDAGAERLRWSACVEELECVPGEVEDCYGDTRYCRLDYEGVATFGLCSWTPLAIDLGDDGFAFDPAGAPAFDIAGSGACLDVDWPVRSTAWLALDRDGDGAIADGSELFGSGTPMPGGVIASNGFAALATLDDDHDGAITARDAAFARLVLWSDHDGDRRGTSGELMALAQVGIPALPLAYERDRECDARGNCVVERASVTTSAGPRALVDLHLACQ